MMATRTALWMPRIVLLTLLSTSTEGQKIVPEDYQRDIRPVKSGGGPTVVAFSMKVNGVFEVNLEDMSLLFELYFRVSWQDERLLYPAGDSFLANNNTVSGIHRAAVAPLSAAANVTSMAMSSDFLKKVWVPDIFIRRTRRIYTFRLLQDFQGVIFHSDNTVFTSTMMQFQLGCAMTFEKYPFDTQECMFYITSYSYSIEELTFKWMDMGLSEDAELEKQLANYDFHLVRYNSTECICLACIPQKTACIKVLLVLRRRSLIHVLGSFVPSSLFVMVGWTSLFWPPDVIPGRTVLAITSLLTVTSMYSAIRQSSPATSYVKAIDVWLFMCVLLTMVPLFQYALVLTWRKRRDDIRLQLVKPQNLAERQEHPKEILKYTSYEAKTERIGRVGIPLVFLVFNLIYWPLFL